MDNDAEVAALRALVLVMIGLDKDRALIVSEFRRTIDQDVAGLRDAGRRDFAANSLLREKRRLAQDLENFGR